MFGSVPTVHLAAWSFLLWIRIDHTFHFSSRSCLDHHRFATFEERYADQHSLRSIRPEPGKSLPWIRWTKILSIPCSKAESQLPEFHFTFRTTLRLLSCALRRYCRSVRWKVIFPCLFQLSMSPAAVLPSLGQNEIHLEE